MENVCGWIAQAGDSPLRDPLKGTQQADWLVIGAGITGLCAAHSLAEMHPQARIVLVDRQRAAQGASARNSGFVVAHEHPTHAELQGRPGFAYFQVDTSISRTASDEVRKRIARHGIECDFRESGYFFAVSDPRKLTQVEAQAADIARGGRLCAVSARRTVVPEVGNPALPVGDLVRQWQCAAATGEVRQRAA